MPEKLPEEALLAILRETLLTVKGLIIEVKNSRRHRADSDEFIVLAIRDLNKVLMKIHAELTDDDEEPK